MKIIVLGAGLVGGPMAIDLAKDPRFEVTLADRNPASLAEAGAKFPIVTLQRDLSDPSAISDLVKNYDMVVNALPGFLGYNTFKSVIEAGKNIVDIAFFIEDPFQMDATAKKNNVIAVMDCGVAPGMCNILIGYADSLLDET